MQIDELEKNTELYYFAYGMLTNIDNMRGAQPIGQAVLDNHKLEFYHYATITKSPGKRVIGGLYKINQRYLTRLDTIEAYPELYDRVIVPVKFNNKVYQAYVYTMTEKYRNEAIEHNDRFPTEKIIYNMQVGYYDFDIPTSQIKTALSELKTVK